jgi:hypothetical protein
MVLTSCSTAVHGYAIPIYITSYKIRSINHKYNTLSCPRTNVLLHRPYQSLNQIRLYSTAKREASALVYYEKRDPASTGSLANVFRCTVGSSLSVPVQIRGRCNRRRQRGRSRSVRWRRCIRCCSRLCIRRCRRRRNIIIASYLAVSKSWEVEG